MIKRKDELREYFESLSSEFEGYVQMSDKKIETFSKKPSWESLHNDKNFIFEACFFDGDRSIMIRQFNDSFIVIDEKLSEQKIKDEKIYHTDKDKNKKVLKVKICQVWDEVEDELCEGKKVLKPSLQLFAGFEGGLS